MSKSIVVMAGGTGGHIFPALAVAEVLKDKGWSITWLGSQGGLETRLVPKYDITCQTIAVSGVRGKGILKLLTAPFMVIRATLQARAQLKILKPDVVLGMGGFVSGPGGLAAKLLGIPLVIHEQNAVPGTTNRLLAKIAQSILTGFPVVEFGKKAQVMGNPIRKDISSIMEPIARGVGTRNPMRLLVLGGSLGALAINELLPKALAQLAPIHRPEVWHQCGDRHLELTTAAYQESKIDARITPFIDDMSAAYQWADLVVARAGALTVSEIAAAGLPSILIPFPFAVDDHQTKNASYLQEFGASLVFQQAQLSSARLAAVIEQIQKEQQIKPMALAARQAANPKSAENVALICQQLAGEFA